jgi:hypothetical protein
VTAKPVRSHGTSIYGASTHGPECMCGRCQPFAKENKAALTHGAYAVVRLGPRAEKIAAELREVVPVASLADSVTIDALAIVVALPGLSACGGRGVRGRRAHDPGPGAARHAPVSGTGKRAVLQGCGPAVGQTGRVTALQLEP